MIKYRCKHCNMEIENPHTEIGYEDIDNGDIQVTEIETEEKMCPVCGSDVDVISKIYWCEKCNVPIHDNKCSLCGESGKYISTDLRPVFPEERLLLEVLVGEPLKFINSSVWNGSGNRYIADGRKLNLNLKELLKKDKNEIKNQIEKFKSQNSYDYFNIIMAKFIEANRARLDWIVTDAQEFIQDVSNGINPINKKIVEKSYNVDEMFVSFSGGKDSTVVSDLVIKSLSNPSIINVFGDTTLEFPTTVEYVKRFKQTNKLTPMLSAKNKEKNFMEMGELIGPPSRVMRWCCTVFKTGPINKKTAGVFKDKIRLLTFYGIRRSESISRSKYKKISSSPKITKQKVVSPIIDWYDFDIWLYIITNNIDFNEAYRLGFARVGCWCCPNNSEWSHFLSSIYMHEQYTDWRNFLIEFAQKVGKPDPEVYVDSGKWKARQGGNGVEFSENIFVKYETCVLEEESFNYELRRPISEQLYELFKPFGWISKEMGNERLGEVFVVDRNNRPILRLQGKPGNNILKVSIMKLPLAKAKNMRDARMKIDCQLTKYQMCVGCLGCSSVCKHNAIIIKKDLFDSKDNEDINVVDMLNNSYIIDDDKCIRCGECINHFDGGCYMRKVLMTKRGE